MGKKPPPSSMNGISSLRFMGFIYIYIYMDLWLLDAKKDAKKHHDHPKIYWAS